jgi:hypothetical protein
MLMNKTLIRKETYVGRVKDMCMDMEDKYVDLSLSLVDSCEHIEEYIKTMLNYSYLIDWKDDWKEWSHEILTENWNEYWSKYNP